MTHQPYIKDFYPCLYCGDKFDKSIDLQIHSVGCLALLKNKKVLQKTDDPIRLLTRTEILDYRDWISDTVVYGIPSLFIQRLAATALAYQDAVEVLKHIHAHAKHDDKANAIIAELCHAILVNTSSELEDQP